MIHPFSLMDRDSHPEPIYELLQLKVDRALIAIVVEECAETVDYALGLPTTSRGRSSVRPPRDSEFSTFVERVLATAQVTLTDILITLVYIRRARAHMSVETEKWALHRVFLGALVLAHKYSNDSTLKNVSWSYATGTFGIRDIGRMEREFLDVLDYELSVSEADLLDLHETVVVSHPPKSVSQFHPFFQTSALERAPRPQGVDMFRTRRISDETSDEEKQDHISIYSDSFYDDEDQGPNSPLVEQIFINSGTQAEAARSSVPASPETPTSSDSSSEPSGPATSAFSYQPHMVAKSKPFAGKDDTGPHKSAISRALWLAGHQLISTLPTAFPQLAVSS